MTSGYPLLQVSRLFFRKNSRVIEGRYDRYIVTFN